MDDADEAFKPDCKTDMSARHLVGSVAGVVNSATGRKHVNVQLVGSPQLLPRLMQGILDIDFAAEKGLKGYPSLSINSGKLPVYYATRPRSKNELNDWNSR